MTRSCKAINCRKEFKPRGTYQVYCCRKCAPYGNLVRDNPEESEERKKRRLLKQAQQKKILQECASKGLTFQETAPIINLSLTTVKVYARKWRISFRRKNSKGGVYERTD